MAPTPRKPPATGIRIAVSACEGAEMRADAEVAPDVLLHGRNGGDGPAVVLLHGHPRAHTTWLLGDFRLPHPG